MKGDQASPVIGYTFPESTRHECRLAGGRTLSYFTFDTTTHVDNPKPVLYLHGFPTMGLEGGMCASAVAEAGGKLYAPDRPGFGRSSPYPSNLTEDEQVQCFVSDLWEFIQNEKWESFSIIAVSGAGPFVLAFLASYLDKQSRESTSLPKLDAVSLVAAMCCSAGVEDMMEDSQTMYQLVQTKDKFLSRLRLNFAFGLLRFFTKVFPANWVLMLAPTSHLPEVDKEVMSNPQIKMFLARIVKEAFQQNSRAAVQEACINLRPKQGCEESLKRHYEQPSPQVHFPRIAIFQGDLDVDVPKSHAIYVYEQLLRKRVAFMEYPDLGHYSLSVRKTSEYAQFALTAKSVVETND